MNYSGCENSLLLNEVAEIGWISSIFTHSEKITVSVVTQIGK